MVLVVMTGITFLLSQSLLSLLIHKKTSDVQHADSLDVKQQYFNLTVPMATNESSWSGIRHPVYFYCYSAFLDDRSSPQSLRVVVVALVHKTHIDPKEIMCIVWKDRINGTITSRYTAMGILAAWENHHDEGKGTWTIHCPIAKPHQPKFITLVYTKTEMALCTRPVVIPAKPKHKQDLGLCGPVFYHVPHCRICKPFGISQQVVPWLEMQKILGVNSVTLYNHSMTVETSKILEYYQDTGFVKIYTQTSIPGETSRIPNSVAINDCLYRNLHSFRKLLVCDLDELIIPRNNISLMQLIETVAADHHVPFRGAQFWFASTLFYTDYKPRVNFTILDGERVQIFKYRHRTPPEPFPGSCKSIIDPLTCRHAHAHMCTFDWVGKRVEVSSDVAKLHHYKNCSSNWWKPVGTSCKDIFETMVEDDIMLVYEDLLRTRMERVETDMKRMGQR